MPTRVIARPAGAHYRWGGANGPACDGWHLVQTAELSIIEEAMPPGARETRHSHSRARQFFFVLEGELTLEVDGEEHVLRSGEGLEIAPGQPHQALNKSTAPVRMLVTSQPPGQNDRIPM